MGRKKTNSGFTFRRNVLCYEFPHQVFLWNTGTPDIFGYPPAVAMQHGKFVNDLVNDHVVKQDVKVQPSMSRGAFRAGVAIQRRKFINDLVYGLIINEDFKIERACPSGTFRG